AAMRGGRAAAALIIATVACVHAGAGPTTRTSARYEVIAVRYATIERFATSGLIAGADPARRQDIAMMVWLARAPGRNVLMDAGFYRDKFVTRWKPTNYERPSAAVARAGVNPEDVTDVIISHIHWDHADGADLFPRARIWIQRQEYEHYIDSTGRARSSTIDSADAAMLATIKASR